MSLRNNVLEWLSRINYLDELKEYLSKPSRSRNSDEVRISALMSKELMEKSGLNAKLMETKGNPVVFGNIIYNPDNVTVLIYGHHDVQPEGNLDEWDSPPFEPIVKGTKLYCRGSADNKGQHYAHFLGLRYLQEFHKEIFNKINVKFILDGDEELGSYSLPTFVKENKDLLMADLIIVSDGPSLVEDRPTIVGAVRGIVSFQINIKHNQGDLHSGNFGGVARSSALDLKNLLNTMVDNDGNVLIKGFYDDVEEISNLEKDALEKLKPVYHDIKQTYKITSAPNTGGHHETIRNQAWPTLNINGLSSGGVDEQRRTIIPSESIASIDCRLVWAQKPVKIIEIIKEHITAWAKELGIENAVSIEFEGTMAPPPSALTSKYVDTIIRGLEDGFGSSPVLVPRLGGSLPIELFPRLLDVPVLLIPYSLPDSKNHAPNENLDIPYFESGVAASVAMLLQMADSI